MNLIYRFLIYPPYRKHVNSVKYNLILVLLLILLAQNNNNNCKNTHFSSFKVKDNKSTTNTYDFNTTDSKSYINKKVNTKNSSLKSYNKLTTESKDINISDLEDINIANLNHLDYVSCNSLNNINDTIEENVHDYNAIDHNRNSLNSNSIYDVDIDDPKDYINKKFNDKKTHLKSPNKLATEFENTNISNLEDINIDKLINYDDTLFKSCDSLNNIDDITNNIEKNLSDYKNIDHSSNNLNLDSICNSDIADTNTYITKNTISENSFLECHNKLTTTSEDINTSYLINYDNPSFKSYDSSDSSNNSTDNIDNHKNIKHSTNNLNSDCIHNSDIIDTNDYLNKHSNLKSHNKLTTTSEDINTDELIDCNDKSFKSCDPLNTHHYNTENIEDNNINHKTDDFISNFQCKSANKSKIEITSTIKHIDNSTNINNCYSSNKSNYDNFNISEDINRTFKLPTLLIKCDISDSFKGDINFRNYIASINDIKNKLVITSNLLLLDVTKKDKGTLFLDGYLETDIDYSIPLELKVPFICKHSNFVLRSPLNISVPIDLQYTVPDEENAFSDLDLSVVKSSFNIKSNLCKSFLLEDYVSLYRSCELTLVANYCIEVFKNEVFHY